MEHQASRGNVAVRPPVTGKPTNSNVIVVRTNEKKKGAPSADTKLCPEMQSRCLWLNRQQCDLMNWMAAGGFHAEDLVRSEPRLDFSMMPDEPRTRAFFSEARDAIAVAMLARGTQL